MNMTNSYRALESGAVPSPEATQAESPLRWIGVCSFTYFSAQVLAFQFPGSFGLVSAIWPAAGIALAALLLSPRRLWPATLGCLFAAGLAANLTTPRSFAVSAGFMTANICETAACAWLITRMCGDHVRFDRIREVLALTAAAFFINAATSLLGAATACIAYGSPFAMSYRTWWIADGLGLLLVTPLIAAWADTGRPRKTVRWRRACETACLFALGGAATWLSFGHNMAGSFIEVKPYLLPVFVIWAALRLGIRCTATLLAAFAVVAIACTAAGIGPFPLGGTDSPQRLYSVQVFLGLLELTGLLLAASVAQKRKVSALLNAVVEGSPDAIYVKDRQGRYVLFNSAAARFVGKPAAEVLGKDDTELFPPDVAKSVMQQDRAAMASDDLTCFEEYIIGGAGEPLAFLSTKGLLHDEEGEVTCLFGISRDITERKKTDAYSAMSMQVLQMLNGPGSLRESIGRVLSFVKAQTGIDAVGLRLQDGEDFPYFAQEGFSEDFLLTENTLAECGPDGEICRDKDGKACLECVCGLVISGKTDPAHPLFTPGGSFWTNDSAPLLDLPSDQDPRHHPRNECIRHGYASMALIPVRNKGRIVGLLHLNGRRKGCFTLASVKILEDLASHIGEALARIQAEESLRASGHLLEGIINAIPVRVFWKDRSLAYLGCNAAFARDAGFAEPKDLIGKDDYQMGWHAQADLYRGDDRAVIESGSPKLLVEEPQTTPEGNTITLLTSKLPLRNAQGETCGILGIYQDITEHKRNEAEIQKIQKLQSVGTLAGGIAHDFNNILQGLFGNIALAMNDLPKEHPSYAFLEEADRSMTRAIRLTKQLLTFSKGGEPVKEIVSLGKMAEEVARFDLTGSPVSLACRCAEGLWPVNADRGQIQQVISNLVINARQAMPKGGHLSITLENADLSEESVPTLKQGRYVKVVAQDDGDGISPKVIDHIFDPYFTTKQTGSGLGLATVWSILAKHGGHIGVVSQMGQGATFTFYLPASDTPQPEKVPPPAGETCPPAHARPARILVMDDDDSVCRLAAKMLARCGYSVATAPDGREAVGMYRKALRAQEPFDAVIMDLTIPGGLGGKEAINDLLAIDPGVRAIVSSGYAGDPVMANFEDFGFKGIAAKPYTQQELREVVARVLK